MNANAPASLRSPHRGLAGAAVAWAFAGLLSFGLHAGVIATAGPDPAEVARDELVAEALAGLRAFDDPAAGARFDYGAFFLKAEAGADRRERARLLARWAERRRALEAAEYLPGPKQFTVNVHTLVTALFVGDALGHYRRDKARLRDFYEPGDPGGNCEAQTKLLVASLRAAPLEWPASRALGVQLFADHVQVVIFDRERDRAWNPLTGERGLERTAPIYHPAILLHAWLKSQGVEPPVQEARLVIFDRFERPTARGKRGGRAEGFRTNSELAFPSSDARFTTAEVPPRTEVPLPFVSLDDDADVTAAKRGQAGAFPVATRAEFLATRPAVYLFAMQAAGSPFGLAEGVLVFDDERDAARFRGLATDGARRELLLDLAATSIRAKASGERLRDDAALLGDLDAIARAEPARVLALPATDERVEQQTNLAEYVLREVLREDGSTRAARFALELRVEGLGAWWKALGALPDHVGRAPRRFVQLLERLPSDRRAAVLALLALRLQRANLEALARTLGDPATPIVDAPKLDAEDLAAPPSLLDVELELEARADTEVGAHAVAAVPTPTPSPATQPAPSPSATATATAASAPAAAISTGVLLDVLLSGVLFASTDASVRAAYRRFDAAASAALVRRLEAEADDRARCAPRRAFEENVVATLSTIAASEAGDGAKPALPAHVERVRAWFAKRCKPAP